MLFVCDCLVAGAGPLDHGQKGPAPVSTGKTDGVFGLT